MATLSRRFSQPNINVEYDRDSDVLYIALGNPVPALSDYENGIIYRFSEDSDEPCGATIVGFKSNHWDQKISMLAKDVAAHLKVKSADLVAAISKL